LNILVLIFCFRYARSVGAKHHHTSAKLNRGIEELFLDLTQQMIAKSDEKPKNGGNGSRARGNNITIVDDSQTTTQKKSGCCGGGGGSNNDHPSNDLSTGNNLSDSSR
jgi:hypothetical protein